MSKRYILMICMSTVLIVSCKTAEFGFKTVDINGMIYDFSNRPIPFFDISLGNKYKSRTDINGRFVLPAVPAGEYAIIGNKKGYETYIDEINVNDSRQIIYIRVPSQKQLLEMADEALAENDFANAEEILGRAFQIDQNSIETLLYFAAVKYRQKDYEKAVSFLEHAQSLGSKDVFIEKFLNALKEIQNGI